MTLPPASVQAQDWPASPFSSQGITDPEEVELGMTRTARKRQVAGESQG